MNRLSKTYNKIRTFWRLTLAEKIWFMLLYPYSGFVRLALLVFPFQFISRHLGHFYQNTQLSSLVDVEDQTLAKRIGKIIELVARYTPWESQCLVQAIMARTMFGFYKISYVMHLGAAYDSEAQKNFMAHAWIKVGPWVVTGRAGHERYGVLCSFVTPAVLRQRSI